MTLVFVFYVNFVYRREKVGWLWTKEQLSVIWNQAVLCRATFLVTLPPTHETIWVRPKSPTEVMPLIPNPVARTIKFESISCSVQVFAEGYVTIVGGCDSMFSHRILFSSFARYTCETPCARRMWRLVLRQRYGGTAIRVK
jgi:hypothetical protein